MERIQHVIFARSYGKWAIWSLEEYYAYERQDIAKRQNSEAHSGIEACGEIPYVFSPSKCISDAIAAAKEESASYKDLKAQQHMSLSALGVLIVSAITMLVTAVGVEVVYDIQEGQQTTQLKRIWRADNPDGLLRGGHNHIRLVWALRFIDEFGRNEEPVRYRETPITSGTFREYEGSLCFFPDKLEYTKTDEQT